MRISHIDIKLTDGSTCVMNMDELPQVIQLSLKDTIFNWLLLRSSAQGDVNNTRDIQPKKISEVETPYELDPATYTTANRVRYKGKKISNHKYEARARAASGSDNLLKAYKVPCMSLSIDTGRRLPSKSKQYAIRCDIVKLFFSVTNKPLSLRDLINKLNESNGELSVAAISNYASQMHRLGVLAKNKEKNTFHLSTWFLDQIK